MVLVKDSPFRKQQVQALRVLKKKSPSQFYILNHIFVELKIIPFD